MPALRPAPSSATAAVATAAATHTTTGTVARPTAGLARRTIAVCTRLWLRRCCGVRCGVRRAGLLWLSHDGCSSSTTTSPAAVLAGIRIATPCTWVC